MRRAILAFVCGVAWLQQFDALPQPGTLRLGVALALFGAGVAVRLSGTAGPRKPVLPFSHRSWRRLLGSLALFAASLLAGLTWAAWRAESRLSERLAPQWEGIDLHVTGTVVSLPARLERGMQFRLRVEHAEVQAGDVAPRLPSQLSLAWYGADGFGDVAAALPALRAGERWSLPVRLKRPHGTANPFGFDMELWMLEQGIGASGYVRAQAKGLPSAWRPQRLDAVTYEPLLWVERLRGWLRTRIEHALPDAPYAGILVALVIGDQRSIDAQDWTLFNRTGVGHLVSISGLHITMIAGLFAALAGWLWRHSLWTRAQLPLLWPAQTVAALAGALSAGFYCLLAGFQIPAQRTFLMLLVVAAALLCGRRLVASRVLALALFGVVAYDPWAVLAPGFWLSFGAVAVIFYAMAGMEQGTATLRHASSVSPPGMVARFWAWLWPTLRGAGRVQWAVTLGLVPLTMLLFQQVSLVSPLANALAIPLVSLAVTPLALLGAFLPEPLCGALLWLAHALFAALAGLLAMMAQPQWAVWQAAAPPWWALPLALFGIAWLVAPGPWRWDLPPRWTALPLLIPVMLSRVEAPPSGEFRLTALDVGQGTAVLVETANQRYLYDTGPRYSTDADAGNRVVLPYLRGRGIVRLDRLIVSHQDIDHAGGAAAILDAIPVALLQSSLPDAHPLSMQAAARAVERRACAAGETWQADGVRFSWLHPLATDLRQTGQKTNALSCVLRIESEAASALLTGDIEAPQERALIERMRVDGASSPLLARILLVPHHGSGTSSSSPFLQAVRPELAIVQAGYRNRFGHPKAEVEMRYRDREVALWRTDRMGAITVESRGRQISAQGWRQARPRYWMDHNRKVPA